MALGSESEWIALPLTVKQILWIRSYMIGLYIVLLILLVYLIVHLSRE